MPVLASLLSITRSSRAGVSYPSDIFVGAGVGFPCFPTDATIPLTMHARQRLHLAWEMSAPTTVPCNETEFRSIGHIHFATHIPILTAAMPIVIAAVLANGMGT